MFTLYCLASSAGVNFCLALGFLPKFSKTFPPSFILAVSENIKLPSGACNLVSFSPPSLCLLPVMFICVPSGRKIVSPPSASNTNGLSGVGSSSVTDCPGSVYGLLAIVLYRLRCPIYSP